MVLTLTLLNTLLYFKSCNLDGLHRLTYNIYMLCSSYLPSTVQLFTSSAFIILHALVYGCCLVHIRFTTVWVHVAFLHAAGTGPVQCHANGEVFSTSMRPFRSSSGLCPVPVTILKSKHLYVSNLSSTFYP